MIWLEFARYPCKESERCTLEVAQTLSCIGDVCCSSRIAINFTISIYVGCWFGNFADIQLAFIPLEETGVSIQFNVLWAANYSAGIVTLTPLNWKVVHVSTEADSRLDVWQTCENWLQREQPYLVSDWINMVYAGRRDCKKVSFDFSAWKRNVSGKWSFLRSTP